MYLLLSEYQLVVESVKENVNNFSTKIKESDEVWSQALKKYLFDLSVSCCVKKTQESKYGGWPDFLKLSPPLLRIQDETKIIWWKIDRVFDLYLSRIANAENVSNIRHRNMTHSRRGSLALLGISRFARQAFIPYRVTRKAESDMKSFYLFRNM